MTHGLLVHPGPSDWGGVLQQLLAMSSSLQRLRLHFHPQLQLEWRLAYLWQQ